MSAAPGRFPQFPVAAGRVAPQIVDAPRAWLWGAGIALLAACGSPSVAPDAGCEVCCDPAVPCLGTVRINEVMSSNDGTWIDELGETDDWIEIINAGDEAVWLHSFLIGTRPEEQVRLPPRLLPPGAVSLVWADNSPEQGALHLPFKLSASGEPLYLWNNDGVLIDRFDLPAAAPDQSFARLPDGTGELALCTWPTPDAGNGNACGPQPPPDLPNETFASYPWVTPWPPLPSPLAIAELALKPAGFVEVVNISSSPVTLADYAVTLAPTAPGQAWPSEGTGVELTWPSATLAPGQRAVLDVASAATAAIAARPEFEGVASLWRRGNPTPLERVDFMWWPDGAVLTRSPNVGGQFRFCTNSTRGAANTCTPLASRPIGDRLRHLYTPGDFLALAEGGSALGIDAVKFVVDLQGGNAVHLLSAAAWDLHYTFIREHIEGQPHLDRCDPVENALFRQGWTQFSQREYFQVEGRRYLLGTLEHHTGAAIKTVEYATGDLISAAQMQLGFFSAVAHTDAPTDWSLRPQGSDQVARMRMIEGQVPIVGSNTPFVDVTFQPLNPGVAYGVLTFVAADQLADQALGRQVVAITDRVPNDIPLVGGLITESLQTPLAHVNILSRNRNSPNMALLDARRDPRVAPFLDELVRYEVTGTSFAIRAATAEEAEAFWMSQTATGPPLVPRLDTAVRGLTVLAGRSLGDLPALGAKAAGLAELGRVNSALAACQGPLRLPSDGAAIPVVHSLEHFAASGATAALAAARADPEFRADPRIRAERLAAIRQMILAHPVEPTLLAEVEAYLAAHFGNQRVRFRSSSNTEDLPGFGGAGIYSSVAAKLDDPDATVADAIRTVWASAYNARAFEERLIFNVDEDAIAMGVLIHAAYDGEVANAVGITRSVYEPIRSDYYTINLQRGEASVANPAPGVTAEQLVYRWNRVPRLMVQARSSLPASVPVMSDLEVDETACVMRAIHDHFRPLLDPSGENRWFAMDIELKRERGTRALAVKQARQYNFGDLDVPADCREF